MHFFKYIFIGGKKLGEDIHEELPMPLAPLQRIKISRLQLSHSESPGQWLAEPFDTSLERRTS
jgi:hypothetical protein